MKEAQLPVQKLVRREVLIAISSIAFAAVYQGLWYLAPEFLARALWGGSSLTIAFALGTLAILTPIISAYSIIGRDAASDEAYETSHH